MKNARIYSFRQLSSILAIALLFTLGDGNEAFSQFSTVINVPSIEYPSIGDMFVVESDTQVNLYDGGVIGDRFSYLQDGFPIPANREVNIYGGQIGDHFDAINTVVNIHGGLIDALFHVHDSSIVNVFGGKILNAATLNNNSELNFYDGTIGDYFQASNGSTINIYGGNFEGQYIAHPNSSTNIYGGTFSGLSDIERGIFTYEGAVINFFGSEFSINEIMLEGSQENAPILIDSSNYLDLSGTL